MEVYVDDLLIYQGILRQAQEEMGGEKHGDMECRGRGEE